jgi:hypothetical protein
MMICGLIGVALMLHGVDVRHVSAIESQALLVAGAILLTFGMERRHKRLRRNARNSRI